jgi:ubiquinone/menaquinone biosynthesis C-methylase UbiE
MQLSAELGYEAEGTDGSEKMVALAKTNHPNLSFRQLDLLEPLPYDSNSFDVALSILVLMSLSDIQTFLKESFRVLKNDGVLLVCVRHPAFSNPVMVLYKTILDKLLFRKPHGIVEDYYLGKQDYRSWDKGSMWKIPYYPRTLQQYSVEFKKAGFAIDSMFEPNELPSDYLAQYPKLEYATRLPRFIFFKLIKR